MTVCTFCSGPISVDMDYRRVIAWERKARATSSRRGGSDMVLRKPFEVNDGTGRGVQQWACRWCVEKQKRGVSVGQESLA